MTDGNSEQRFAIILERDADKWLNNGAAMLPIQQKPG